MIRLTEHIGNNFRITMYQTENGELTRYINPSDIYLPRGYQIDVYAEGLDLPNYMMFLRNGDILIAESGYISQNPRVVILRDGVLEVIAEGFHTPMTGVYYWEGDIYVSHKGFITVIRENGQREDLIFGLPSSGDFSNNNVVIGPDEKIYFGQGTATNSGVVGTDNLWLLNHPFLHDYPGDYIMLVGQNFKQENIFVASKEIVYTGAFSPFGVTNMAYEVRKAINKASGSILRANLDGSELELVAWGLRNPARIEFDRRDRLYAANHGYDVRGSRPIANAPDEFYRITPGLWYGWPDYSAGESVTSPRFMPEGRPQPQFLLTNHPNNAPEPFATFPQNSTILGFDFDYSGNFGNFGDVFIAEFGTARIASAENSTPYAGFGHRISRIDMSSGGVTTFAINKSGFPSSITGEGGFGRPCDVNFGPDGAMYILDMGINAPFEQDVYIPNSGLIWKVTRV